MEFAPGGVACGAPRAQVEKQGLAFFEKLRPKMRPDRAHLVPSFGRWPYFVSVNEGGEHPQGSYQQVWPDGVSPVATVGGGGGSKL